jgi:hypothetical protein
MNCFIYAHTLLKQRSTPYLIRELEGRFHHREEAVLHALLKCRAEAVLGEGEARVVGHDVLLDRGTRGAGAIFEGLDGGRGH